MVAKIKPHLIVIVCFAVLSAVLFPDAFQDRVVKQADLTRWRGIDNKTKDHLEKTGEVALWNNSPFGGMPAFFAGETFFANQLSKVYKTVKLYLPGAIGMFFAAMLCAYILFLSLGVRPLLGAIGAIATAFVTYNFIIYQVGHMTKFMVIIYFPLVAAGLINLFKKRYLLGGVLYGLGLGLAIFGNHIQMTYYLAISLGILFLLYTALKIKEKDFMPWLKTVGVLSVFTILALLSNYSKLNCTYQYMKKTMRGPAVLETKGTANSKNGLSKDYVFSWSHGVSEVFTYIVPRFLGGSSEEVISSDSELGRVMESQGYEPKVPLYWGSMPFTSGPTYFGAVVIFLFVLGIFLTRGYIKWWIVSVTILFTILSFGKNMAWFNDLMYYYFPMYSKFRSVNSCLTVLQFTFPILAVLGLREVLNGDNGDLKNTNKKLYLSVLLTGGLCLLIALLGPSLMDFTGPSDERMNADFASLLRETRASLLRRDAFRSFLFIALGFGVLWLVINNKLKLKKEIVFAIIGVLVLIDLGGIGLRYLNSSYYIDREEYFSQFVTPRAVDIPILQDPDPNYRVFDASISTFNSNMATRYHNTIGGYTAAKMRRYQDMIDYHIGKGNMSVLNMLNTKYFIQKSKDGNVFHQQNPNALGNCWFVDTIGMVQTPNEEIESMDKFNPRKKAFVHKEFTETLKDLNLINVDSGTIIQTTYGLNELTYKSNSNAPKLAVFSEVWYESGADGWQAYIDEKPVEHIRANYILRALPIPAGEHVIRFEFKPKFYLIGERVSLIASIGLILISLVVLIWELRKSLSPVKN